MHLSNGHCVVIALLADASDDGLQLTREMDSFDDADPAYLSTPTYLFCIRIVELYVAGKARNVASYTAYMIEQLRDNPITVPLNHKDHASGWKGIGGEVPQEVLQRALRTMGLG